MNAMLDERLEKARKVAQARDVDTATARRERVAAEQQARSEHAERLRLNAAVERSLKTMRET